MTTKPQSNDEVREELKKHCWVDERDDHQMPLDEVVALLAQKHKEVADARREERRKIIQMAWTYQSYYNPIGDERNKGKYDAMADLIKAITPPDQTANPTN